MGVQASAFKALESQTTELNDQSKLSDIFSLASKMFGKGTDAAVGALVELHMHCTSA